MVQTPKSEWVTPKEAAASLGVSIATVYRLMGSLALPWTKIGGGRRIPRAALAAMATSNFVGDATVLRESPAAYSCNPAAAPKSIASSDQLRRGVAERFRRARQGPDFELAYCYRRVLGDIDGNGEKEPTHEP